MDDFSDFSDFMSERFSFYLTTQSSSVAISIVAIICHMILQD